MFDLERGPEVVLNIAAAVGLGYSVAWLMRRQQLRRFQKVGTVKELVVFPVKSCSGVNVSQAECTQFGLSVDGVGDRHWMLIRENNRFLTLRQNAKMALIKVALTDSGVVLNAPGMTSLKLPTVPKKNVVVKQCISVLEAPVEGIDCGDEAAEWVSQFLDTAGLRIVHYTPDLERRFYGPELDWWETTAMDGDVTAYADWASYLLASESSLDALNKELPSPVPMRTFRPNVIITGTTAYDEDNWTDIKIGDTIQMRCVSSCPRCVLTTVDPDKGARRENGEPLKTLKRIRKSSFHNDESMFGMYLAPDICGQVKIGDPVYALRKLSA